MHNHEENISVDLAVMVNFRIKSGGELESLCWIYHVHNPPYNTFYRPGHLMKTPLGSKQECAPIS